MAAVQWHTVEQFYDLLEAGVIQNNAMRIAKWLDEYGENGMTRNQLTNCVFCVIDGINRDNPDCPRAIYKALDGGEPIKWRSIDSSILWLLRDNPNKIGVIRESKYTVTDQYSDTKKQAKLLFPYWVPQYKINQHPKDWPPQMELFDR